MQVVVGAHVVAGQLQSEVVIMAIGCQPIGNVVVRDSSTGKFRSLTSAHRFGRATIGDYSEHEVVELESRPNPRPAAPSPSLASAIVLALVVLVVAASSRDAALAIAGVAVSRLAARSLRAVVGYVRREFVHQWWIGLFVVAPCVAFLAWVASAGRP